MKLTKGDLSKIVCIQQTIDALLSDFYDSKKQNDMFKFDDPILDALCRITADCEEIIEQSDLESTYY